MDSQDRGDFEYKIEKPLNGCVSKPSDFSIEHILNKAGSERFIQFKDDHDLNDTNGSHMLSDLNNYPPILDWLQYTRYRPPRIPRPTRNGPIKRTPGRLPRIPFTPFQLNELESAYAQSNYLSSEDANKLAKRLDLTCIRVKIWFQNRRARERREKRGVEFKSTSPSISPSTSPSTSPSSNLWHQVVPTLKL